jgi:membrane-associated phospholipid phosphatase
MPTTMNFTHSFNIKLSALLLIVAASIWLTGTNQVLFIEGNTLVAGLAPDVLRHWTSLADLAVIVPITLIIFAAAPRLGWQILIAGFLTGLLVQGLKYGIGFPRPAATLSADAFNLAGPALKSTFSFPSGHSATIGAVLAPLIIATQSHWLRILLCLLALAIALGRIAVGAHWPLDVIFGLLFAWWVCLACYPILQRANWPTHPISQWVGIGLLAGLTVYVGYFHRSAYEIEIMQIVVATTALIVSWSIFGWHKKKTRRP